jgi:hypothetical protein
MKHLIISDAHSQPGKRMERADWIGDLIVDVKPDVVIDLGDTFEMGSLSSYDKGTRYFHGRSYSDDISTGIEFQDRVWARPRRQKQKMPYRVAFHGNHEYRLQRLLDSSPELMGSPYGLSMKDFQFEDYNDKVVPYNGGTPGVEVVDGIAYAHYFVSGTMGRAISSEHTAHKLITTNFMSSVQGHTHCSDYCVRSNVLGNKITGLVCPTAQQEQPRWAGEAAKKWTYGVTVLNVENGAFTPEFISMERLEKEYATR